MRKSQNVLLLFAGLFCLYASVASENKAFEVNGDRLSDSVADESKLTEINSGQKRASWLDFKRNGGREYDESDNANQDEAKRASWLDFKRDDAAKKRASWLDFKRGNTGDLKPWLENKRASWLDFKKRASWLDFKRTHGNTDASNDKRASWLDFKRAVDKKASWLDFKRNTDKKASWLDFKRDNDKRASWLDFKRNGASPDDKRASWLDFKRALGSWIEAKQTHKRGNDNPMDPETIKVIREMLLKDKSELTPSMRENLLSAFAKDTQK
ncbi:uncharacterized protein LOC135500346 [Lineus longissimus]|uniref:uncharacterized protein LOC135500346 n=1 Tax=Lineus longissimus TaxID=88925 RepID=UPI002B4F3584